MKAVVSLTHRLALVVVTGCLFLFLGGMNAAAEDDHDAGAVYVLTNLVQGNTVVVYHRGADGALTRVEEVATGGRGSGPGELPPGFGNGPGPNPLDSQDGLVLTDDGRFLLAVNSRSNDVSVFAVGRRGLQLVDRVPSNGNFPVSIAHHKNLIYVLNEGESPDEFFGGVPNMTGFTLDGSGKMHPITHSTRITGTPDSGPSEAAITPDGKYLVITEMFTNLIKVFEVREGGLLEERTTIGANNPTPLAVDFGRHNLVAITEGNDTGHRVGSPNGATLSTYRMTDDGGLVPISRAVNVNKTGTCWVRFSPDGRFAFTGDTGSGTVSSFAVSRNGKVTLLGSADTGGLASVPIDLGITRDGKFLYVLASFSGEVRGFRIRPDGSLTPVGIAGGLPITIQGIVVR
jgi:6-phosphogluconolactonase (cycloisomerase 2 family)